MNAIRLAAAGLAMTVLAGCEVSQSSVFHLSDLVEPPSSPVMLDTVISVAVGDATSCSDNLGRMRSAYRNYLVSETASLACVGAGTDAQLQIKDKIGLYDAFGYLGHYEGIVAFAVETDPASGDTPARNSLVLRFNPLKFERLKADLARADAALTAEWSEFEIRLEHDGSSARTMLVGAARVDGPMVTNEAITLVPGATTSITLSQEALAQLERDGSLSVGSLDPGEPER
jgi:hypothetical protein